MNEYQLHDYIIWNSHIIEEGRIQKGEIFLPVLTKGEAIYETPEAYIQSYPIIVEQQNARKVFEYASSLIDSYYYLSDGIMFRRKGRKYKFLSISTVGNRVLFHVPVNRRDTLYEEYRDSAKIIRPHGSKDKNQLEIKLSKIESMDTISSLIQIAYGERE